MPNTKPLYKELAQRLQALWNSQETNNQDWIDQHSACIDALVKFLPSGSGIDNGTKFDQEKSRPERLIFNVSYHHMDQHGGYDGWTEHSLIVTPSLAFNINLRITGRDRNDIKDYLHEVYSQALTENIASEMIDGQLVYSNGHYTAKQSNKDQALTLHTRRHHASIHTRQIKTR